MPQKVDACEALTSGVPYMTMATGAHFEEGAAHGVAAWAEGGAGESKKHWRNDAPNPLRSGASVRRGLTLVPHSSDVSS